MPMARPGMCCRAISELTRAPIDSICPALRESGVSGSVRACSLLPGGNRAVADNRTAARRMAAHLEKQLARLLSVTNAGRLMEGVAHLPMKQMSEARQEVDLPQG